MEGFHLDSDTVKDCAEPPAAVSAASHFQDRGLQKMVFRDSERCDSATCDSAYGSECYSSVTDRLQGLHIDAHIPEYQSSERIVKSNTPLDNADSAESRTVVRPQKRPAEEPSDDIVLTSDAYDQDDEGDTPLSQSIIFEKPEIARKFIRYTTVPEFFNIRNCLGQTALMLSVHTGQANICRALVVAGASVDIQDQEGNTALHLACRLRRISCIQALTSPINQMEIKSVLSARNQRLPQNLTSQLRLKNYEGLTCIHMATLQGNIALLQYLLALGADINERDGKSGRTALHYAVEMNEFNLVHCLLSSHANVDAVTFDRCTPLHLAAGRGHEDIALMLHGAGADTKVQNFEGQYAFELTDNEELEAVLTSGQHCESVDVYC